MTVTPPRHPQLGSASLIPVGTGGLASAGPFPSSDGRIMYIRGRVSLIVFSLGREKVIPPLHVLMMADPKKPPTPPKLDEVLKRLLETPPKPRTTKPPRRQKPKRSKSE